MKTRSGTITLRAGLTGFVFAGFFAFMTVMMSERGMGPTATQIPVMPYVLLLAMVLLLNPLLRLIPRARSFTAAEVLLVFTMGLVSSGVSTFGFALHVVPMTGNLFNPAWNNEQTEWNRHVVPQLNDRYFLAVDGIQSAAGVYAEAVRAERAARERLRAAARLVETREALDAAGDGPGDDPVLGRHRREAHGEHEDARRAWQDDVGGVEPSRADLDRLREEWNRLQAAAVAAREDLARLEESAFDQVELYRRGLPEEQRAYPGMVWLPGDTRRSYRARLSRARYGARVARNLSRVHEKESPGAMLESVRAARIALEAMAGAEAGIADDVAEVREREQALSEQLIERRAELRRLSAERRAAGRDELRALERRIHRGQRRTAALDRRASSVAEQRRKLEGQLGLVQRVHPVRARVEAWEAELAAGTIPNEMEAGIEEVLATLPEIDGTWRRLFLGDVPWGPWMGPLLRWSAIVGLTYLVLMMFNVLIFRQWAHHEKLIYPLAELPEALLSDSARGGVASSIFRSGLFWAGFLVSGSVLAYNIVASTDRIPGMERLDLNNAWGPYIQNTAFDGLQGGRFNRSHIFFTMIGLSFLIPKKVSFSLWFFSVLSMVQVLILVWSGYGHNEHSFPHEWWYILNFRTSQGGGAMIVFSTVTLYKCRRYLLCAFRARSVEGLEPDERVELRVASFLFVMGSAGLVLMMWLSLGANLWHCIFAYFIIMMITIGLTRAVAEGGILGFQAWVSPFHFIRTFFGMDQAWTHASMFSPIMVYYAILFLDLKTFIAPAMANSLKIREDLRMQRGRFHLAMFAAILVSAVVAVVVVLMMSYDRGANVMEGWFHTAFPQWLFGKIAEISQVPPSSAPDQALWVGAGALTMGALLFFRQTAFWLPHPIGLVMLVSRMMGVYWFSIMLGWLAKSVATKYGSKDVYAKARTFFIGLIIGELILVVVAMIVATSLDISVPVDLNRT